MGITRHLLLGEDRGSPRVVSAYDALVGKGCVDLVWVAVWRMVQGFVIGPHGTRQQSWVTHLVMCRLENRLSVGCKAWHKRIVRVHPYFLQQSRSPEVCNDEEWHFLNGSIHHELEYPFQGNAASADSLENRGESGRCGIKLFQEALGKGAYILKALKPAVRGIDSRLLVPEQFLFTEQASHLVGLSRTKCIDKRQIGSIFLNLLGHILIESLKDTGFANWQFSIFLSCSAYLHRTQDDGSEQ